MLPSRKFPIPYDYFKAIVALFLLLLIIWSWRNSGPAPTMNIAVDASGVVTFSGETKPGATAQVTLRNPDGSLEKIRAQADDAGQWLASKRLQPGNYEAIVDIGGRKSPLQGFEVPESAALSEITVEQAKNDPYLIKGRATANKKLLLYLDGEKYAQIPVGPDGSWEYRLDTQPGNHTIQLAYAEAPEITSATITLDLPILITKPTISNIRTEGREVLLAGKSSTGSNLYIWVDGQIAHSLTANGDGSWSTSLKLPPGKHEIKVSKDKAGAYSSQPVTVTVSDDTQKPQNQEPEAQKPTGGFPYVVKEGDWLTKLARDYLGSEDRYVDIRQATNAKAANDPSFDRIEDDNLIFPGEKIWIPSK